MYIGQKKKKQSIPKLKLKIFQHDNKYTVHSIKEDDCLCTNKLDLTKLSLIYLHFFFRGNNGSSSVYSLKPKI